MATIKVSGIKLYAYHGCLDEEAKIGCNYIVDVAIESDISEAAAKDDLTKTVDYVSVYEIVKKEMAIRSRLIENVAKRIADKLIKNLSLINAVEVTVTKVNPPVNGDIGSASVTFTAKNRQ
jgi:7,8-dihydroneopterin aldolase/epimerase/oxygenase